MLIARCIIIVTILWDVRSWSVARFDLCPYHISPFLTAVVHSNFSNMNILSLDYQMWKTSTHQFSCFSCHSLDVKYVVTFRECQVICMMMNLATTLLRVRRLAVARLNFNQNCLYYWGNQFILRRIKIVETEGTSIMCIFVFIRWRCNIQCI